MPTFRPSNRSRAVARATLVARLATFARAPGRALTPGALTFGALTLGALTSVPLQAAATDALPPARWLTVAVGEGARTTRVPVDRFEPVGEVALPRSSGASAAAVAGGAETRWLGDNRPEIGSTGIAATDRTSRLARARSSAVHWIVGRYAADRGELLVDVLRLERARTATGALVVRASRAPFTPGHGARWVAHQAYLTAAERAARPDRPGRDPFAAHAGGASDPVFHAVGPEAAQVIMGHAMQWHRAPLGLLATTALDVRVTETRGGSWLRRRVTTTIDGHALTRWALATPLAAQPWRAPVAVCVADPPPCTGAACTPAPCPAERMAASGVAFELLDGAPFDASDTLVSSTTESHAAWTLLGVGLLLDPGTFAAAASLAGLFHAGDALTRPIGAMPSLEAAALQPGGATAGATADAPAAGPRVERARRGRFTDAAPAAQGAPAVDPRVAPMRDAAALRLQADPFDRGVASTAPLPGVSEALRAIAQPDGAVLSSDALAAQRRDAEARYRSCLAQGLREAALRACAFGSVPAGD